MFVNADFSDLLKIFNDLNVRYLVIDGYATIQYSEPRFTNDLDLWIGTDRQNAESVFAALKHFGAPLENLTTNDFAQEGYFYQMGAPPFRVDILMGIPGVQFEDAWKRREIFYFDDLPVIFISREDLIQAKKAAGRPQDLIDIERLTR